MKRNENVLSISTISAIVLSLVAMMTMSIILMASVDYAKELGDEFGGPGIGIKDSSWDGSVVNRIYGYGDLNGIVGDEVCEHKALPSNGPTNYVVYDDTNPIDHSLIDMGPRSANNDAYSLHFINDGGPGMKTESNALGKTQVYNDGGPGFTVSGLTGTENVYVDKGPVGYDKAVDPSDFVKLMNMKPGDFTFVGGTRADKLGK
ncbi:MAG: hypothetical protein J6M39_09400 [Lachnospiraceae bacterium]|nr:hypothetical protein [Lachnospiraceae bacterium]